MLKNFHVRLEAEVSKSFLATKAAQSLDIDVVKKSIHELSIRADVDSDFQVGLIVGASGSGKTTLAREIYGSAVDARFLTLDKALVDQFPLTMQYDDIARALTGIGLASVPCWIKPAGALSNGQKARAEAALALAWTDGEHLPTYQHAVVLDEWTSVVDRMVAKIMSHCVQKFARRVKKRVVLVSCHYDVIEWLDPDWVIDCNAGKFVDRRLLHPDERRRAEKIHFDVREVGRDCWRSFSKYHYLSENLPGGRSYCYGLFHGENQIGFNCFSNYVPHVDKRTKPLYHVHRTVIHPDYAGLGLGIHLDTETSRHFRAKYGSRVLAKFSSIPFYKMMARHPEWRLLSDKRQIGRVHSGKTMGRHRDNAGFRENVRTFSFEFIPR